MSNAERQAAYRARRRAERVRPMDRAVYDPQGLQDVAELEDDMAELRAELDATKAELAEANETIDELNDELIPLRAMKARLDELEGEQHYGEITQALRKQLEMAEPERNEAFIANDKLQAELAAAKKGVAKSVTRNVKGATTLRAELKRSSKYYGQTEVGELFPVSIVAGGEYVVQGGPGGQYRLKDVWLWAVDTEGKKTRLA
ncbi:hypothetical protein [Cupriavidus necator]|uniref:hypothetical protein n=1 Tax=Cupriavidus necator TaxID=106590 RepID=UPI002788D2AA|nr:hypothetical protein [Cupriavidus necator]MDQ0138556.1 chromosome segregation ATPase [Cupriavidus necator]